MERKIQSGMFSTWILAVLSQDETVRSSSMPPESDDEWENRTTVLEAGYYMLPSAMEGMIPAIEILYLYVPPLRPTSTAREKLAGSEEFYEDYWLPAWV